MKTLHRYVLSEYLKALFLSLAVFTGFAAAASLYRFSESAAKSGLSGGAVVSLAGYLLPYVLLYAMPLALFTAAIVTFGRLSADNEFVAIKASGIHPGAVVAPILAAGLAASLMCVLLADAGMAIGFSIIRSRLLKAAPGVIEGALVAGRSVSFTPGRSTKYTINVLNPPAWSRDSKPRLSVAVFRNGRLDRLILARAFDIKVKARPSPGGDTVHVLRFKLTGGQMLTGLAGDSDCDRAPAGLYRPVSFEKHRLEVPLAGRLGQGLAIGYRRETMGLSQNLSAERACSEESRRMAIRIAWLEKRLAQIEAGGALAARIESRRKGIVTARKAHRRNERRALSLKIEFHKKLSMSFACLAFVLLGIPLGLASRQKSRALGLGLGSAVAFCGYYPPMLVGDTLAEAQMIPPWAGMWLPVALVALIGLVWTLRAVRR